MSFAFQIKSIPEIYFGTGELSKLPVLAKRFGKNALLITGRSAALYSPAIDTLKVSFEALGMELDSIQVHGEPGPELIDKIAGACRNTTHQVIIAIGGGSILDTGKAVSAMLTVNDSVVNYLEGIGESIHPGTKVPFIAIPTTSGTGSEATKNAVLSKVGKVGYKRSLRHDNFVPDIAIVDPELTLNCPREITAASGMDAFTQLLESYVSSSSNAFTDALAMEGLRSIAACLVPAYDRGDDLNARTGMAFASMVSGITLANAGLGVIHGFASSIGGYCSAPHGIICGSLMARCNEVTIRRLLQTEPHHQALNKYATAGRLLAGNPKLGQEDSLTELIKQLHYLTAYFKIPRLSAYGIDYNDIPGIVSATFNKNNPVPLDASELSEILESRL